MPPEPVPIPSLRHTFAIVAVIGIVGSITLAALGEMLDVATTDRGGASEPELPEHVPKPARHVIAPTGIINDTAALPFDKFRVDAIGDRRLSLTEAHIETIALAQADELLAEDLRLRNDADADLLLLWFDDCFRHNDDFGDCIEATFIEGGGKLDESLRYCSESRPVSVLTSNEVAALDAGREP